MSKMSTSVSASIVCPEVVSCKCISGYEFWVPEVIMSWRRLSLSPLDRLMSKDAQSTVIHRELIKLLRQVMEWKNRPHVKFKDECGVWYGTARFVMVNRDYKSNFLEALKLMDWKTHELPRNECLFVM